MVQRRRSHRNLVTHSDDHPEPLPNGKSPKNQTRRNEKLIFAFMLSVCEIGIVELHVRPNHISKLVWKLVLKDTVSAEFPFQSAKSSDKYN